MAGYLFAAVIGMVFAAVFGGLIAWSRQQERERRHKEKMVKRSIPRDTLDLHREMPIPQLTERERARSETFRRFYEVTIPGHQSAHQVSERIAQDMARMESRMESTMGEALRRSFEPLDRALDQLQRQGPVGFSSVTIERTESRHPEPPKAEAPKPAEPVKPEPPRTDRFDRILRDD
jgi:hypothetical protein